MISNILIAAIAIIHIYIMILEMFLWDTQRVQRAFNLTPDFSKKTKTLAANQGLYNGFLAAGLIAGLGMGDQGFAFKMFFLICIAIAGIFGAITANRKIFFIQTVPALIALLILIIQV
ncbi:DUF1304 domain-containing protein [Brucellaceae bacterium C25G]